MYFNIARKVLLICALFLFFVIQLHCGSDENSQLKTNAAYIVSSTCTDAQQKSGTLHSKDNSDSTLENAGYFFNGGEIYGLPQNQAKLTDGALEAKNDKRKCRAPLIQGSTNLTFICLDASQQVCVIKLKLNV